MNQAIVKNDCYFGRIRFDDHGFADLPRGAEIGPACWNRFDIMCVHRGRVNLSVAGAGRFELNKGDGVLLLPETRFEGTVAHGGAHISVQHYSLLNQGCKSIDTPKPFAWCAGHTCGAEFFQFRDDLRLELDIKRAIEYAAYAASNDIYDMRVAQLILILGQIHRQTRSVFGAVADFRALILQNKLELSGNLQDITPSMMAAWVNLSASRFRVWFKEQYGISPKAYLIRHRISLAMRMLRETRMPIKAISDELGYTDLTNFYHAFRKRTHTTPSVYRHTYTVHS